MQAPCREDQQPQRADVDEVQITQVEADAGAVHRAGTCRLGVQGPGQGGDVRVVDLSGEGEARGREGAGDGEEVVAPDVVGDGAAVVQFVERGQFGLVEDPAVVLADAEDGK